MQNKIRLDAYNSYSLPVNYIGNLDNGQFANLI